MIKEKIKDRFSNDPNAFKQIKNLIYKYSSWDKQIVNFIENYVDFDDENTLLTSTTTRFNIAKEPNNYQAIINLSRINDIRFINKFFETVNSKLPYSGIFIGCFNPLEFRRSQIFENYPKFKAYPIYWFDFLFKRVFPKLRFTRKIYFYLTKGKGRVISKAEVLGRLYSCGFKVLDLEVKNNTIYFISKKTKEPSYDENPTYGPLIKLERIGVNGKKIYVYKLRTMHPYSEYLQEYIYNQNRLKEGGKIKDDYRITPEGKFFRKIWLDEIPMLINLLKGEMKLVGVRPLSQHYFNLYSEELKKERIKVKPGFIPPFYADNPKSLDEILVSEMRYLESYKKRPFMTDLDYLVKALNNVFFKGLRSF